MFGYKITARIVGFIAFGLVILLLVTCGPGYITSLLSAKQEARVEKGQKEAAIESGAEATSTLSNLMEGDSRTKAIVEEGLEAIRNAPEAEKAAVAERSLCRLKLYAETPRCQPPRSN